VATTPPGGASHPDTLYARLGGEAGVRRMLVAFYGRILADPEIAPFFTHTSMDKLLHMQNEFFNTALDGPHEYTGGDLARVHANRGIGIRHFTTFVQHLVTTLREVGVKEDDVHDVVYRVSTLRRSVTGK